MGTLYLDRSVSSYVAILLAALSHWWAVRRFTRGHDISPRECTRKWWVWRVQRVRRVRKRLWGGVRSIGRGAGRRWRGLLLL